MSYDKKYRERAVEYRLEVHTIGETSRIFKVGPTTLKKWIKQYKATGDLSNKPLKRSPKKICPEKLLEYLREHPDAYQSEIGEAFGCSQSAVSQTMRKQKITRKKRQSDTGSKIAALPASRLAYVDECGVDSYVYREYGWSPRGEKLYSAVSGRKYQRVGIVAAQIGSEIVEPLQYDGAMDSRLFETWFESRLLLALPEKSFIGMDNATFHRKRRLIYLAQSRGHEIIFLPPYSPELKLIEHFWSWLKRRLRKILHRFDSLDQAL